MKRLIPILLAVALFAGCGKSSGVSPTNNTNNPKVSTSKVTVSVNYTLPYRVFIGENATTILGNSDSLFYHNSSYSWYPHVGATVSVTVSYSIQYIAAPAVTVSDGTDSIPVDYTVNANVGTIGQYFSCQFKAK